MGGPTTTTQTTTPSNPDVNPTVSMLLKGVQKEYGANPQGFYFPESMYAGVGNTTRNAWQMGRDAAAPNDFGRGVTGAMGNFADVASGKFLGNMDPEYQSMIDRSANQTAADINASMGSSGRYGSNVHVGALADSIGALRTGANVENRRYEQARQAQAATMLPQLLQANQMPAEIMAKYGALEDADRQASLQGRADLATRKFNAPTDFIAKLTSAMSGNAAASGSNTTMTKPGPNLLQLLLGTALGTGALFL